MSGSPCSRTRWQAAVGRHRVRVFAPERAVSAGRNMGRYVRVRTLMGIDSRQFPIDPIPRITSPSRALRRARWSALTPVVGIRGTWPCACHMGTGVGVHSHALAYATHVQTFTPDHAPSSPSPNLYATHARCLSVVRRPRHLNRHRHNHERFSESSLYVCNSFAIAIVESII